MVLKKSKTTNDVLFIDASNECKKVTNNNKLTDDNISNILKYFVDRKQKKHIVEVISNSIIGTDNDYNLSVNTYVQKEDTREKIDIKVLNQQIADIVSRENKLRIAIDKIIEEITR